MDQFLLRRRGDGTGRGGFAGLRQLFAERGLRAVQRARESIGDVVRQAFARQDEAPRAYRIDWRRLVRIAARRNRERLEERSEEHTSELSHRTISYAVFC